MKTLEEVKEHFKNATHVKCLGVNNVIRKINLDNFRLEGDRIYCCMGSYAVLIQGLNGNLAEITQDKTPTTYKFEGKELEVESTQNNTITLIKKKVLLGKNALGDEIFEGERIITALYEESFFCDTAQPRMTIAHFAHSVERAKEVAIKIYTDKINAL